MAHGGPWFEITHGCLVLADEALRLTIAAEPRMALSIAASSWKPDCHPLMRLTSRRSPMAVDGVAAYERYGFDLPPIVQEALRRARDIGVASACLPEQGLLLQVLARGRAGGRIGETGTGCGVGLAWLASATYSATTLVSVERDPVLAAAAAQVFQDWPNVSVLCADWTAIGEWAPFDLLVLDAGAKVDPFRPDPVDLLAPQGALVIDDFTPMRTWPPRFAGEVDADRLYWLEHPLLLTTEIRLTASASTLVATRRQGR
jgi:predicted O-methyltransferase YrrM